LEYVIGLLDARAEAFLDPTNFQVVGWTANELQALEVGGLDGEELAKLDAAIAVLEGR
jgi:hypothetical protein